MKHIAALLLFCAAHAAQGAPFAQGDAAAGQRLFEQNQCNRCHIQKVGGDGSAIFTRANRIVNNPQQMIARMHVCSGAVGMTLTHQNEQDLGDYLNQQYYKFK